MKSQIRWIVLMLLMVSLIVSACEPEDVEPQLTPVNGELEEPPPTPTSVPPTPSPAPEQGVEGGQSEGETLPDTGDATFQAGLVLFQEACAACHQSGGEGVPDIYPGLDGNAFVRAVNPIPVTSVIIEGRGGMPAFYSMLDPAEVAAVVTYIRGAWSNDASGIEEADAREAWERTNLPLEEEDNVDEEEEEEEEEDE
jgi:mono/diheme cytochrome c family protein